MILDSWEISKYLLIPHKELHRDVYTLPPNIFEVYINNLIVAVEAAKEGVTVRENAVSGWTFAGKFIEHTNTR